MEKTAPYLEGGQGCTATSGDELENAIFLHSVISVVIAFEDRFHSRPQKEPVEKISLKWISIHRPPSF